MSSTLKIKYDTNGNIIGYTQTIKQKQVNQYDSYANSLGIPPRNDIKSATQQTPIVITNIIGSRYQYGIPNNVIFYY